MVELCQKERETHGRVTVCQKEREKYERFMLERKRNNWKKERENVLESMLVKMRRMLKISVRRTEEF